MNSALEIEKSTTATASMTASIAVGSDSTETVSAVEWVSYLICCAVQGALGVIGFACLTIVPIAVRHGLLSHGLG